MFHMNPLKNDLMSSAATVTPQAKTPVKSVGSITQTAAAALAATPSNTLSLEIQEKLFVGFVSKLGPLFSNYGNTLDIKHLDFLELHQFIDLCLITMFVTIYRLRKKELSIKVKCLMGGLASHIVARKWITPEEPKEIENLKNNLREFEKDLGIDETTQKSFDEYLAAMTRLFNEKSRFHKPIGKLKAPASAQEAVIAFKTQLISEFSPALFELTQFFGRILKQLMPKFSKEILATLSQKNSSRPTLFQHEFGVQALSLNLYMKSRIREFESACLNLKKPHNQLSGIDTVLAVGHRFTKGFAKKADHLEEQLCLFANEVALNTFIPLTKRAQRCMKEFKDLQFEIALDFSYSISSHMKSFLAAHPKTFFKTYRSTREIIEYFLWILPKWTDIYLNSAFQKDERKMTSAEKANKKEFAALFPEVEDVEEKPLKQPKELSIEELKKFHTEWLEAFLKKSKQRLHEFFKKYCPSDYVVFDNLSMLIVAGLSRFRILQEQNRTSKLSSKTLGDYVIEIFATPKDTLEIKAIRQGIAINFTMLYAPIPGFEKNVEKLGETLSEIYNTLRVYSAPMKLICERSFPLLETCRKGLIYRPIDSTQEDDWWLDAQEDRKKTISTHLKKIKFAKTRDVKEVVVKKPEEDFREIFKKIATAYSQPVIGSIACIRYFLERQYNLPLMYQPSQVLSIPHVHSVEATVAFHQKLMSMNCLMASLEMFYQCQELPLKHLLSKFISLHRHLSVEQALTEAGIIKSISNPYKHNINELLSELGIGLQTPVTTRLCASNTQCLRYPAHEAARHKDLSKASIEIQLSASNDKGILLEQFSKQLPDLMKEYKDLILGAFQKSSNAKAIPDFPIITASVLRHQMQMDAKNASTLKQIETDLLKILTRKVSLEPLSKPLNNVFQLLDLLSVLPRLIELFPDQRLLFTHAHICLILTQYIAENIGSHLADTSFGHNLKTYRVAYGLGRHLKQNKQLWEAFLELNVRKGSEYFIEQFQNQEQASKLIQYLNNLYVTSEFETQKIEGVSLPNFKSLPLAEMHKELVEFIKRYVDIVMSLVEVHVFKL